MHEPGRMRFDSPAGHWKVFTRVSTIALDGGETGVFSKNDFRYLAQLDCLEVVSLQSVILSDDDLAFLDGLPRLTALALDATTVSDKGIVRLQNCTGLHCLDLNHTRISDVGVRALKSLTELRELSLCEDPAVTDSSIDTILQFPRLEEFYCAGSGITPSGVERLRRLRPSLGVR
jgi:hypothetical protein